MLIKRISLTGLFMLYVALSEQNQQIHLI